MQAAGLSQADSLVQLPFRSNCLNWVLGHLVSNRRTILKLLGDEQTIDGGLIARYEYGSEPITGDGEGVLALEQLLALLDHSPGADCQTAGSDHGRGAGSSADPLRQHGSGHWASGCSSFTSMTATTPGRPRSCARLPARTIRSSKEKDRDDY